MILYLMNSPLVFFFYCVHLFRLACLPHPRHTLECPRFFRCVVAPFGKCLIHRVGKRCIILFRFQQREAWHSSVSFFTRLLHETNACRLCNNEETLFCSIQLSAVIMTQMKEGPRRTRRRRACFSPGGTPEEESRVSPSK